jgi:hypothetical protein
MGEEGGEGPKSSAALTIGKGETIKQGEEGRQGIVPVLRGGGMGSLAHTVKMNPFLL